MPLDDFMAAFDKFNQGLRDVSSFNAINEANETVKQIKTGQMKDFEQRQAIQGVANDLATRLGSYGVDPRQAAQFGANMMPAAPPMAQSAGQVLLNKPQFGDEQVSTAQGMQDQDQANKKRQLDLQAQALSARQDAAKTKADEARDKYVSDHISKFMTSPDVKPIQESLIQLNNMKTSLSTRSNTGFSMAVSGMIRSGGDTRINEEDLKRANVDKSYWHAIQNYASSALEGKPMEADYKIMEMIARTMEVAQTRSMSGAVKRYAAAQGGLKGVPESEFVDRLSKRIGDVQSVGSPGQQQGSTPRPPANQPAPGITLRSAR